MNCIFWMCTVVNIQLQQFSFHSVKDSLRLYTTP